MQQPCLFIGGNDDGLTHPAPDDAESLQWPVCLTSRERYHRVTLSLDIATVIPRQLTKEIFLLLGMP
jgi:hypothetical protein